MKVYGSVCMGRGGDAQQANAFTSVLGTRRGRRQSGLLAEDGDELLAQLRAEIAEGQLERALAELARHPLLVSHPRVAALRAEVLEAITALETGPRIGTGRSLEKLESVGIIPRYAERIVLHAVLGSKRLLHLSEQAADYPYSGRPLEEFPSEAEIEMACGLTIPGKRLVHAERGEWNPDWRKRRPRGRRCPECEAHAEHFPETSALPGPVSDLGLEREISQRLRGSLERLLDRQVRGAGEQDPAALIVRLRRSARGHHDAVIAERLTSDPELARVALGRLIGPEQLDQRCAEHECGPHELLLARQWREILRSRSGHRQIAALRISRRQR